MKSVSGKLWKLKANKNPRLSEQPGVVSDAMHRGEGANFQGPYTYIRHTRKPLIPLSMEGLTNILMRRRLMTTISCARARGTWRQGKNKEVPFWNARQLTS
jgi:hypothetical protein